MKNNIKYFCYWFICLLLLSFVLWKILPSYNQYIFYLYYLTISTSFIAIPHEPLVLFYGNIDGPLIVTLFGIVPTVTGCYLDFLVLTPMLNNRRIDKYKETKFYLKVLAYFEKAPFIATAVFALSPLPFYPIRLLSIASQYSKHKYASAVLLGRIPRYFIIAATGIFFNIKVGHAIIIFVIMIIWYIITIIYKKYQIE